MPYFSHQNIKLYYEISGKGAPILFINGLGGDTRSWEPLVAILKSKRTVISFDMRCAGRSDKPLEPFAISNVSSDAAALMKNLGFETFDVLGHSMGGMVAIDLALDYSDRTGIIFLISTAPAVTRPFPMSDATRNLFNRTDISPALLTDVFNMIFGPNYKKKVSAQNFIDFRFADELIQPTDAYLNQLKACISFDRMDDFKDINSTTIIITGDSDLVIPPDNSKWMQAQLEGSKLITMKGIGHMLAIEAPKELADIVAEYL